MATDEASPVKKIIIPFYLWLREIMLNGEKFSKYFVTDDPINFLCIPSSFKMHEKAKSFHKYRPVKI